MNSKKPFITVIGGLTMDLFYTVPQLPQIGKSVEASDYKLVVGGKGFNIATVIKRFENDVNIISSVGKDKLSQEIFETLIYEGFEIDGIIIQENFPTDLITLIVSPEIHPGIIGTQKANYQLTKKDIEVNKMFIIKSSAVIATLEVPASAIEEAFHLARKFHIPTFLRTSPVQNFSPELLILTDYLFINQWDIAHLLGERSKYLSDEEIVIYFYNKGVKNVIYTKEEQGCVILMNDRVTCYKSFDIKDTDNTGSNSAFIGVFVCKVLQNKEQEDIIRYASAAGALTAIKIGSREAMPTKNEIEYFLSTHADYQL